MTNRLREIRESRYLTLEEVAKLLDSDITTVSKHETGGRGLTPEAVRKYAKLYKVDSYALFMDPAVLCPPK